MYGHSVIDYCIIIECEQIRLLIFAYIVMLFRRTRFIIVAQILKNLINNTLPKDSFNAK